MNYNKVMIAGNLCRDPELKYTPSGVAVVDLTVAINRRWKDKDGNSKEKTVFIGCTAFKQQAEAIAKHLKKGNPIFVEGELTQEEWDDKTTGKKQTKTKVTVNAFHFIGGKREDGCNDAPRNSAPATAPAAIQPAEDDVPF